MFCEVSGEDKLNNDGDTEETNSDKHLTKDSFVYLRNVYAGKWLHTMQKAEKVDD